MKRISEAARDLGVSTTSLRRWSEAGRVPELRTPGGQRLWTPEMIAAIRVGMAQRTERDRAGRIIATMAECE